MKNLLIAFLAVFVLSVNISSVETGAAFLKLGMGARPVGLGGAFTAISNDVNAIAYNPAGIAQLESNEYSK